RSTSAAPSRCNIFRVLNVAASLTDATLVQTVMMPANVAVVLRSAAGALVTMVMLAGGEPALVGLIGVARVRPDALTVVYITLKLPTETDTLLPVGVRIEGVVVKSAVWFALKLLNCVLAGLNSKLLAVGVTV